MQRPLPDRLSILYPFASCFFEQPDGLKQHFIEEGDGEDLILMVHGNPSWSWLYRELVLLLREKGRCLAVDHIGCGLSERPPRDYDLCLNTHTNNLTRLLETRTFRRLHLVVHDWGGPIGIGSILPFAERLGKVVILNTSAFPMKVGDWRIEICRRAGLGPFLSARLGLFPKQAIKQAVTHPMSPAVAEGFLYPYQKARDRRAIGEFVRDIPIRPSHRSWSVLKTVEAFLPALGKREVLIRWGAKDFCFDERFLVEWRERLPHATVRVSDDAGHYVLEDAGDQALEEMAQFLTE